MLGFFAYNTQGSPSKCCFINFINYSNYVLTKIVYKIVNKNDFIVIIDYHDSYRQTSNIPRTCGIDRVDFRPTVFHHVLSTQGQQPETEHSI
jgi:hypothetical protein